MQEREEQALTAAMPAGASHNAMSQSLVRTMTAPTTGLQLLCCDSCDLHKQDKELGHTCSALLGVILGDSLIAIATGLSSWDGGPAVAKASVPVFTVAPATPSVPSAARHFHHLIQQETSMQCCRLPAHQRVAWQRIESNQPAVLMTHAFFKLTFSIIYQAYD